MNYDFIRESDPDIYYIMEDELERQRDHIELIASENFTSEAVMEAMGSHLTNKYAEGYPGAMAAARTSTISRRSPSAAPRRCTRPNTPTFSRMRVPRRTSPCTRRCCSPATPSWA